jgi:formate C-acetyltransferase
MRDIAKQHLAEDTDLTDEQKDFYQAVIITMEAALNYCKRFSLLAKEEAAKTTDAKRRDELQAMSEMFAHLMEGKARNFWEAVETVYLTHLLMMIESNGHSFSLVASTSTSGRSTKRISTLAKSAKRRRWRS